MVNFSNLTPEQIAAARLALENDSAVQSALNGLTSYEGQMLIGGRNNNIYYNPAPKPIADLSTRAVNRSGGDEVALQNLLDSVAELNANTPDILRGSEAEQEYNAAVNDLIANSGVNTTVVDDGKTYQLNVGGLTDAFQAPRTNAAGQFGTTDQSANFGDAVRVAATTAISSGLAGAALPTLTGALGATAGGATAGVGSAAINSALNGQGGLSGSEILTSGVIGALPGGLYDVLSQEWATPLVDAVGNMLPAPGLQVPGGLNPNVIMNLASNAQRYSEAGLGGGGNIPWLISVLGDIESGLGGVGSSPDFMVTDPGGGLPATEEDGGGGGGQTSSSDTSTPVESAPPPADDGLLDDQIDENDFPNMILGEYIGNGQMRSTLDGSIMPAPPGNWQVGQQIPEHGAEGLEADNVNDLTEEGQLGTLINPNAVWGWDDPTIDPRTGERYVDHSTPDNLGGLTTGGVTVNNGGTNGTGTGTVGNGTGTNGTGNGSNGEGNGENGGSDTPISDQLFGSDSDFGDLFPYTTIAPSQAARLGGMMDYVAALRGRK
jgi:hypothetical protein